MNEGECDDGPARGGDEASGSGPESVEEGFDVWIVSEFFENSGDNEDDDDARGDETECSGDGPGESSSGKTDVGGHVDAERAWCGFTDRDHICELIEGEPTCSCGHICEEGDGGQAATDGEESDEEEFYEEF